MRAVAFSWPGGQHPRAGSQTSSAPAGTKHPLGGFAGSATRIQDGISWRAAKRPSTDTGGEALTAFPGPRRPLEEIGLLAERWRPDRTLVCLLVRACLEEKTHEIAGRSFVAAGP